MTCHVSRFVSHVLLTLNSSTNLLIYCLVVASFRSAVVRLVTCRSGHNTILCMSGMSY